MSDTTRCRECGEYESECLCWSGPRDHCDDCCQPLASDGACWCEDDE